MKLLSVIVPVYNVADYLEECLDSIVSQTYRALEIIVVDDGSTDGSGAICDAYAQTDSRIVVIHQANQGLSGARNTGLDVCKGEYITFIDSDDCYGTSDVLEQNVRLMEYNDNIDFVQFPFQRSNKTERECVFPKIRICDREERYIRYLTFNIFPMAWNKIYRSCLIADLRFEPGAYFEDEFFMLNVIDRCRYCVLSDAGCYSYRIRVGSIMQSPMTAKKYSDRFRFMTMRLQAALQESPQFYTCHFAILSILFNLFLKIPECRTLYKEQGYDFLSLIPIVSQRVRKKNRLLFLYRVYRLFGASVCRRVMPYLLNKSVEG